MKRYLSFLLVLCLLLTLAPVAAFADSKGDITMQASSKIRDLIKKYEGAVLDENGNHKAYVCPNGYWTIGYGHTGYVPCKGENVKSGMTITQQEADELLLYDLNEVYAPSVNKFVNSHRDLYPDGFTQNEFDVLVSLAFGFGAYWIDYYSTGKYEGDKAWRLCTYLKEGIFNYSDAEIADAIVCLWSNLNGLLKRRMDEARIFLYNDYDGTGPNQLVYVKFSGASTKFTDSRRNGNAVACYIKGQPYGELPWADKTDSGYFVGWKTSDGKVITDSSVASESLTVTAMWGSSQKYKLVVKDGSGSGLYTSGSQVKVSANTKSGQRFTSWSGDVNVTRKSDGNYYVTIPDKDIVIWPNYVSSLCQYGADCPSKDFTDVPESYWAHSSIDEAITMGLFVGTSTTTFSPNAEMTRGMLVTVLYRLAGSPSVEGLECDFPDVVKNGYYNAILWAHKNNIAHGFSDGTFRANEPISREQFVTFLQRFAANIYNMPVEEANYADLSRFTDAAEVDRAYRESMSWAVGEGIISGTSATTLSPNNTATRAQVAVILSRFTANT